jgi:hypothetical protein
MSEEKSGKRSEMPTGYGQFYIPVFYNLPTPASKIVYITLAQLRNIGRGKPTMLTDNRLARLSGITDKSVRSAIKDLVELGAILVGERANARSARSFHLLDTEIVQQPEFEGWISKWLESTETPSEPEDESETEGEKENEAC